MFIISFRAERLHGYLSLDVSFNRTLTFLTGINGSGKTSVVRSTVALLSPSLRYLASTQYKSISVLFNHDGLERRVTATRQEDSVLLSLDGVRETLPIVAFTQTHSDTLSGSRERESLFYREWEAKFATNDVMKALAAIPTPMFLDLERRAAEGAPRRPREGAAGTFHGPRQVFAGSLEESLAEARDLAETAFREASAKAAEVTEALRHSMVLSAFQADSPTSQRRQLRLPPPRYLENLKKQERLVRDALLSVGTPADDIKKRVTPFFGQVRRAASKLIGRHLREGAFEAPNEDTFRDMVNWIALRPRELQIRRIVKSLQEYKKSRAEAFAESQRYLDLVNGFLVDSHKKLRVSVIGRLQVQVEGSMNRPLSALSSGERQLVVILTHLAFNAQAKRAGILIIDEPELSLHVHWQEQFVDAVRGVSPHLQLVLATHSPSIILDRTNDCVDLPSQSQ